MTVTYSGFDVASGCLMTQEDWNMKLGKPMSSGVGELILEKT